jgi:hypothetical protein
VSGPPHTESSRSLRTLGEIEHNSEEESTVAAYKRYYERFRNIEKINPSLPIREEAKLADEYLNARDAFNQWLQFVTGSIQEQDKLEPSGAASEFPYRERADAAATAISKLDDDVLQILHEQKPLNDSDTVDPRELYALGQRVRKRFDLLKPEDAVMAGKELFEEYAWSKP